MRLQELPHWFIILAMKKFWFQIIGLMLLTLVAAFLTFNQDKAAPFFNLFKRTTQTTNPSPSTKLDTLTITAPDGTLRAKINIEIAKNKETRAKGLGYRASLASDSGMLFFHENSQKYTYWMKGMEFPIDIMWIKDDTIADIIPNVPRPIEGQSDDTLERYSPTVDVDKVLETNAGFVSEKNIQKGDKIKFEIN